MSGFDKPPELTTVRQREVLQHFADAGEQGTSILQTRVGNRLADKGLITYVGSPAPWHIFRITPAGRRVLDAFHQPAEQFPRGEDERD